MSNAVKPKKKFDEAGARVLDVRGNEINWLKPPKATDKVRWSKRCVDGKLVTGSLFTIAWLDRLDALAIKKYGKGLSIIQPPFNMGVEASAGTHDRDCCIDLYIEGVGWWEVQWFVRVNGGWGWYRYPPLFGNHVHCGPLPPHEGHVYSDDFKMAGLVVGKYVDGGYSMYGHLVTSSQIDDYYNHRNGLKGHAHDPSKFPAHPENRIFDLDAYIARRAKAAA